MLDSPGARGVGGKGRLSLPAYGSWFGRKAG
jgi:hypothetical protein